ncbi:OmpA family protein [Hymenobacter lapidiphilus]|uniref:OmpA family protein n=1 Tax=Hymenobacter lapidiphilus TaxID=2608003 RepID=A0A7Y7PPD5_9BACT|nr:OmpA family protein [Hymenobacter lapidiphilus]NVO31475.1 OmpA family protein [Hymenobacter lapidiphilus]
MKKSFLPALAAIALLASSCSDLKNPAEVNEASEATADTAVVFDNGRTAEGMATSAANATEDVFTVNDAEMRDATMEEIDLPEITVRENDRLNLYGLDEEVLFDTDKAVIKPTATRALSEIGASINRRYQGKQVRVLGFADSRGSKDYNMDLARERAAAVKEWLVTKGMMKADMVSIESMGEKAPVATNATPAGRQQNRRVEIAVLKQ